MNNMKTAMQELYDWVEQRDFYISKEWLKVLLEKEKKQHGETWDAALKAGEDRAWNVMRAYTDFDEYWDKLNK